MSTTPKKLKKTGTSKKKVDDFEPDSWECTVCTFRNNFEAFKCDMCDTRKGTSTRKPRLNFNVVQQQTLVQNLAVQNERALKKQRNSDSRSRHSPESNALSHGVGPSSVDSSTALIPSAPWFDDLQPEVVQMLLNRPNRSFPGWLVDFDKAATTEITNHGVTEKITKFPCRMSNFDPFRPYDVQHPVDVANCESDERNDV